MSAFATSPSKRACSLQWRPGPRRGRAPRIVSGCALVPVLTSIIAERAYDHISRFARFPSTGGFSVHQMNEPSAESMLNLAEGVAGRCSALWLADPVRRIARA
jgi:hypothetical protein